MKKEKASEKIESLQAKLVALEEKYEKHKENAKDRETNPYRIRIKRRTTVKWLVVVAILCFAMGLLTPIGDEPYTHIFKLLSGTTTDSISEHHPVTLINHHPALITLTILLGLLIFTDVKISLKDLFMLGGLTILTLSARRQFSLLLIIGVFSFTRLVCDLVNKYDKNGTEEFTKLMVTWKGRLLTIILIVLCSYLAYRGKINDQYINATQYPTELANYMLEEKEIGNLDFETMKIYNDYNYGSYLLYRGIPVFIDSRADLYSPEFNEGCTIFEDYMNISNISTEYETMFEKYGITHVIMYKNSKLNMLISKEENYKELYKDDYFVFYERDFKE